MTEYNSIGFTQVGEPMKARSVITWSGIGIMPSFPSFPQVEKIIFNPPCTIVLWSDKTKTVVRCTKDNQFDEDAGFATAFIKRFYGSRRAYQKLIAKADRQPKDLNK
jgi:hypothetical protein